MINPCPLNVPCVPCADGNPLAGNSSEAPDEAVFTGISFQSPPLPLGAGFQALGCIALAQSAVSLEEAELLAEAAALQCATSTWTINTGPGTSPNPPAPPSQQPSGGAPYPIFLNTPQMGSADCPDGTSFFWTTPAGLFAGSTQAIADAKAQSYAMQQAAILKTCLSALPPQICANTAFNQTITATGMDANEGANNWELLSGMLPVGVSFSGSGVTGTFAGTATTPGVYPFGIGVTGMDGGFVQKFYTVAVAGINDDLPQATIGTAYSGALTTAGFSAPTFNLAGGTLPDGLTLNADGTVTGTPAGDAMTATFTVAITDGVTGLVCMEDVSITVAAGGFPWNLSWDSLRDLSENGGSSQLLSSSINSISFQVDNGNQFGASGGGAIDGTMSYTGPDANVNAHGFFAGDIGEAGTFLYVYQDGNLIFSASPGNDGPSDTPFTINAGVNSLIDVEVVMIDDWGGTQIVSTLTLTFQ